MSLQSQKMRAAARALAVPQQRAFFSNSTSRSMADRVLCVNIGDLLRAEASSIVD